MDISLLTTLSPREREIVDLSCKGLCRKRIATTLLIEPKTVDKHFDRIFVKLNVRGQLQIVCAVLNDRINLLKFQLTGPHRLHHALGTSAPQSDYIEGNI